MPLAGEIYFDYRRSMKDGPNIALIGSLVGDPARANMLEALMGGKALTASELAREGGVTPQTASSHLAKLEGGGLVTVEKQGRYHYYRLSGTEIAEVLEGLAGFAMCAGHLRTRTGPKDPALRRARVCYDHLAGDLGVRMFDGMQRRSLVSGNSASIDLTRGGEQICERLGLDLVPLRRMKRPLCKTCLDWSTRRHHLAGALGAALLSRFYELKWARRENQSQVVTFSPKGETQFNRLFGAG
jgi:DNA-binding transcriptional ArsR family regulator